MILALAAALVSVNTLTIPPMPVRHRTLANGLDVYSVQDNSSPNVSIQVWYRVGSKDDPPGRSGFAHLFEHMMFKSTKHMKSEMLDRLTEDVGGENNATTGEDTTWYYETVPSNYLQTLLWAEGDRMGSLNVDDANFKSEREVVKEEFRTSVLAPPYGLFGYDIDKDSFTKHPYKRPGIGSIEDLDAATIDDVRKFHDTFYRPDNAALVVVGDFDPAQLDAWVDKYLGAVPKPSPAIPRVDVKEPPRAATKHITEHGPNVPLPAIAYTWLAPPEASADRAPLEIAAGVLAIGESSRLYQSLVYKQQLVQDISAYSDLRGDLGLFAITSTLATGKTPKEVEAAINKDLRTIIDNPISKRELQKVKNLIITSELRRRETNSGKASAIGRAVTVDHDPAGFNTSLQKLQAVTAADVQRVMRKYVGNAKPVIITYVSEEKKGGAK
jgi:zinc protease